MTLQSSHECHLVDRPSMVTWRAVGAGIVELVETPPKLDRRPRRMGTLGVADPVNGGPWGWRTLGMADLGDGGPLPLDEGTDRPQKGTLLGNTSQPICH